MSDVAVCLPSSPPLLIWLLHQISKLFCMAQSSCTRFEGDWLCFPSLPLRQLSHCRTQKGTNNNIDHKEDVPSKMTHLQIDSISFLWVFIGTINNYCEKGLLQFRASFWIYVLVHSKNVVLQFTPDSKMKQEEWTPVWEQTKVPKNTCYSRPGVIQKEIDATEVPHPY